MVKSIDGRRDEMRPSLRDIAGRAAAEAERQAIRLALQATRGNKSEAARLLRVDYKTLHLKIKQYDIAAGRFKDFGASFALMVLALRSARHGLRTMGLATAPESHRRTSFLFLADRRSP
jgi:hypothetical protein